MTISVIIPTFNRADTIGTTLQIRRRINGQLEADAYEVIVADSPLEDGPADVVRAVQATSRVVVRYVYEDRPAPRSGRCHICGKWRWPLSVPKTSCTGTAA